MHRFSAALFAALIAMVLGACGSSTQTVTAPTTNKCAVTATADTSSFKAGGGSGNIAVSTNRECQWTATSASPWLAVGSASSGQGDGRVAFSVAANSDPASRRATVNVNDQQVAITQDAAPCQFTVSPVADTVLPAGERRTIAVTANSGQCAWTASSNTNWIAIVSGAQGTGNGTVTYEASPTAGPTRNGSLTVAGQTVAITQGTGCAVVISPTGQAIGAGGGSGNINVASGSGCTWTATSSVPWVTITSGGTGSGPGTVAFNVTPWNGPARSGTILVNGETFTITQGAGCALNLSTSSTSIGAGGGSGSVQVNTADGCSWNASSNASWISITAGRSGSGNGAVQFSVSGTSGPARIGTLTIGDQTFTVSESACSINIAPTSQSFNFGSGAGTIAVTAAASCSWSASASQGWVHITGGTSGSGNGNVQFTVDANGGSARDASITVAGQTFSIHQNAQNAGCTYSLNPTSATIPVAGGTGSVAVTTGSNCTWSASAPDSWARITSGASGTGNGTVQFIVDQNTGAARSSTLTIAGIAFTISQDPVCTYSISPSNANYADPAAHNDSFALTASRADCAWTATASDVWIQITSAQSGTGSATITYSVVANTGPARSGTISVGGQTFSIAQASGACTIAIAPTSQAVDAVGGGGTITVTTSSGGCGWAATPDVPWITITTGASGTGNGTVTFTVLGNPGAPRTGHIDVSGQTFTVQQNGAS